MLHKLCTFRSSHPLASKHRPRLELEALEDRMAPALVVGGAPAGPYVAGGTLDGVPGSSMNIVPQNSPVDEGYASGYATFFRGFDNFSSAYVVTVQATGSPTNPSLTNLGQNATSGSIGSGPVAAPSINSMQVLGQMQQLVGTLATLAVAQAQNPSQVFNLAIDEFIAAADAFALAQAQGAGVNTSAIQSDLTAHLSSIQNNPVDHTPIGQLLGTAVHDTALYMLAINRGNG